MNKSLVVIGGGGAGHKIAFEMREIMDVTLVDPKTYWEVPMALPRLLVQPDALPARMAYKDFLPNVRHIQGKAVRLSDANVTVETPTGTEIVPFDFAVIATGSRYLDPLIKAEKATEAERSAEIAMAHRKLGAAREVVVVGGGPVGVEVAAELRETFPDLIITLVHARQRLLDNAPSRFAEWARTYFEKKDIRLVLNDTVVEPAIGAQPAGHSIVLKSGRRIGADMVVWAAGTKPMTDLVRASWPMLVQQDGLLKTDHYLRLEGHSRIFVAGDVTNLPERRLIITASFHVPSIVGNLKLLLAAASPETAKLKIYKSKLPGKGLGKIMIVTLGRRDGLSSLPFGQIRWPLIARTMKSANMFVAKYRGDVGLAKN